MNAVDAASLIADAVPVRGGTWADLGAGEGVFTRALLERLGPGGVVYAVDRDDRAIAALRTWAEAEHARVIPVLADFTEDFDLPGQDGRMLDGMLLANALHFVSDAEGVLARLAARLRPGGRVVIVEYDRSAASRWVPHPIPPARLSTIAAAAGLSAPVITATRRSTFGGDLYVATADRLAAADATGRE